MDQYILLIITLSIQLTILVVQIVWGFRISKKLEKYKQEITITNTTYSKFIEIIMEYYNNIYRFYQICSNVANYTTIEYRDRPREFFVEIYDKNLEDFERKYNHTRGTIRLLLPNTVFKLDDDLLFAFNNFRDTIDLKSENYKVVNNTLENKKKILEAFKTLHSAKQNLENALRETLRVDSLLLYKVT